MILVVDGLNRHLFTEVLDEMFELRARVFGGRLGWDVNIEDGKEIDQFDHLDPAYVIGLDDEGNVVAAVRALQTTGPHMLSMCSQTSCAAKHRCAAPPCGNRPASALTRNA